MQNFILLVQDIIHVNYKWVFSGIGVLVLTRIWDSIKSKPFKSGTQNEKRKEEPSLENIGYHRKLDESSSTEFMLLDRSGRDALLGQPSQRIFKAEKEIWISGTTLNVAKSGAWKGFEETNAKIYVLLPDYRNDETVTFTSKLDGRGFAAQKRDIQNSYNFWKELKAQKKCDITIRLLEYSPCYSIFAVDPKENVKTAYISIELTGYDYDVPTTPNFTLFRTDEVNQEFYNGFVSSWENMWKSATKT